MTSSKQDSKNRGGDAEALCPEGFLAPSCPRGTLRPGICASYRVARILKYDRFCRISKILPFQQAIGVPRLSVLSELGVGDSAVLEALDLPESVQNHLMHMGFVPNAVVTALRRAPAGDPTVYGVDGMVIALRHETAAGIRMRPPEAEGDENPEAAEAPGSMKGVR
jgi:Fe2+ transport system protein FeoA